MPAAHGLAAYATGDHAEAARLLGQAMPHLSKIGGSIAQRSLFGAIHLDALMRSGWNDAALKVLQADDRERAERAVRPSARSAISIAGSAAWNRRRPPNTRPNSLSRQYRERRKKRHEKDLTQVTAARALQALPQGQGLAGRDHEGGAGAHRAGSIPTINALCHVDIEPSPKAARGSERRWKKGEPLSPIDGVPVSIKELVRVKGWPASMGSKLTDKTPADADAPAVARLREAGAIVFAQSTSSEYGHKGVTDSPLHGITRNPWNTERTPGGSSGGAGAAVAAGLGPHRHRHRRRRLGAHPLELQRPGRHQGHVRPRAGLAAVDDRRSFRTPARCARTALDCALMLNAISQPDPRDAYGLPADDTDYAKKIDGKLEEAESRLRAALRRSSARHRGCGAGRPRPRKQFEKLGCKVEEVEAPFSYAEAGRAFVIHWLAALQRLLQLFPESRHNEFDPNLLASAKAGLRYSLQDVVNAQVTRRELADRLEPVLRQVRPAAVAHCRRAALRGRQEPCPTDRRARPTSCGRPTPRSSI